MPVRSCLRSYGSERSITVKHYESVVYMTIVLHSTSTVRSGKRVDMQHADHVDQPAPSNRVERDEDTGAHETRAIPPTRQIPTTPSIRSEEPEQMTAGTLKSKNGSALEDPDALTKSKMTGSRTMETAHGNSWLMTCRCHESIPRLPATLPGSRPSGGPRFRPFPEMRRWLTAAS